MAVEATPDGRMDVKNASKYLNICQSKLNGLRSKSKKAKKLFGPKFLKLGGKVFYFKKDLDIWINEQKCFLR